MRHREGLLDVYCDTNIWNALADQRINLKPLTSALAGSPAKLVLGNHVFYEIAKNFWNGTINRRGQELLDYVRPLVQQKVPWLKEPMELLTAEMHALKSRSGIVRKFILGSNYDLILAGIKSLCNTPNQEDLDRLLQMLNRNKQHSANARSKAATHIKDRPDIRKSLQDISPYALQDWMNEEVLTDRGAALITGHILHFFPDAPFHEAIEWALGLQNSAIGRMARALARADLYYDWRCAHRGSNPADLFDDLYHVLNAVYADVYVTAESKQRDYAKFILPANTVIGIYDGEKPIDRWLEGILEAEN